MDGVLHEIHEQTESISGIGYKTHSFWALLGHLEPMRQYLWLQPTRHRKHQCRTEMAGASMVRVERTLELMSVDGTTVCAVRTRVQGVHLVAGATSGALTSAEDVLPGAPQCLRVSSKRTASLIKIRWQEPSYHAHAVHHYEMQMRSKKTGWAQIATSRKLSAEATKLSADTKYFFRVRAVNGSGRAGDFSEELEAETRFSKAAGESHTVSFRVSRRHSSGAFGRGGGGRSWSRSSGCR